MVICRSLRLLCSSLPVWCCRVLRILKAASARQRSSVLLLFICVWEKSSDRTSKNSTVLRYLAVWMNLHLNIEFECVYVSRTDAFTSVLVGCRERHPSCRKHSMDAPAPTVLEGLWRRRKDDISPFKRAWLWSRDCFKILPFAVKQHIARVRQQQLSYLSYLRKRYDFSRFIFFFECMEQLWPQRTWQKVGQLNKYWSQT